MENNTQEKEIKKSSSSKSRSKNDSSKAKALNKKGVEFYNTREYEKALAKYEAALQIKPNIALYLNNKGDALFELDRYEEALIAYEAALKIKPGNDDSHNFKGYTLGRLGRYEEALIAYEAALKIKPKEAVYLCNKAWTLHYLTRNEEALAVWEMVLNIKPKNADYWNGKGDALYALERYEEAVTAYGAAIERTSHGNMRFATKSGRVTNPPVIFNSFISYKNDELFNQAIYYNNKGNALCELQRYEEALIGYEAALKIKPNDDDYLNNKGNALSWLDRYEEALIAYEAALKIKPDNDDYLNNKGNALSWLDRYEEALIAYEAALKIKPDDDGYLNNKGNALCELQRYEEALIGYEAALKIKPNDDDYLNNKGNALSWLDRYEEALIAYEAALKIKPDDDGYLNNKGNALCELQRYEEALIAYEAALKIKPDDDDYLNNKGNALSWLDRYEEALIAYEAALKISPGNSEYLKNKARELKALRRGEEAEECLKLAEKHPLKPATDSDAFSLKHDKKETQSLFISSTFLTSPLVFSSSSSTVPEGKYEHFDDEKEIKTSPNKEQKHTGKRSYDNLAGATKLSHPITPKKWETYLKKIRTTKTGHLSTAKNNCAELLDALVKGTVQHNFETAPTRPSSGTYSFEARTVERSYGKTQRKRYLTLEDSFISYLGDGLHRWLEPPHQTLMDLRDDTAPKEGKQIALDTVEQEGFAPTTVARVHLEATLQKLARENGGWALIGVGFSRLMPLPSDLEGSQSEAKRQLFKTPGHFCGVYVVTPKFNTEHGNKLKESHPSELITFLEPQAIYPRTKERCIAHKPEELFNIATEDQKKISANTFDNHFSLLVLNSQLKMEARAKNKRLKVEGLPISISPTSGKSPPLPEDIKVISTFSTQTIISVLTTPPTPVKPQIIDPERLTAIPLSPVSMETAHIKDEKKHLSHLTAHNFFPPVPISQTLQAFQQKLKQLCGDNGYTFSITRPQPNQLIVHFTALNSVLADTDEIRKELVALTRLWQKLMTDTGISIKPTQLKPDWKNWSLTITADAAALNPVAKLLCTASAAYLPSQAESNLMSDTSEVASCAMQ